MMRQGLHVVQGLCRIGLKWSGFAYRSTINRVPALQFMGVRALTVRWNLLSFISSVNLSLAHARDWINVQSTVVLTFYPFPCSYTWLVMWCHLKLLKYSIFATIHGLVFILGYLRKSILKQLTQYVFDEEAASDSHVPFWPTDVVMAFLFTTAWLQLA